MDPTQALADLLSHIDAMSKSKKVAERNRLRAEAVDCLQNLNEWFVRGGFPPDIKDALARAGLKA